MSLSAIEKLFVFRTNILVLGDLHSIWRAPLLFLMALLVWCLGIATIYPPGALIVTFEAHNYTEDRNVSLMNPPVPQDLEFLDNNTTFPALGNVDLDYRVGDVDDPTVNGSFMYLYVSPSTLRMSLINHTGVFQMH
jgi:apolipoprotein N-acyltransferase